MKRRWRGVRVGEARRGAPGEIGRGPSERAGRCESVEEAGGRGVGVGGCAGKGSETTSLRQVVSGWHQGQWAKRTPPSIPGDKATPEFGVRSSESPAERGRWGGDDAREIGSTRQGESEARPLYLGS